MGDQLITGVSGSLTWTVLFTRPIALLVPAPAALLLAGPTLIKPFKKERITV
ncbi:hypothetical protein [Nonomuraea typhae]|uniref:hypothetical protein n=1 Tax=Nonomuraea typhae TaxID=2603600 RepID=UPI0012F71E32|nr:hypothetical protein [Nonomuraea typhae]